MDNATPNAQGPNTGGATWDVTVIGGGLAGLVAAATAARKGATVALLDARSLGGRARTTERDGFLLNDGGHALYRSAGGWAVLQSLGIHPKGSAPPAGGPKYCTVWDGEVAPLPVSTKSILTSRLLGTRSKLKLGGWFNDLPAAIRSAGDRSFGDWLDGEKARPDLIKYVTAMGRLVTYAACSEELPARVVLGQFAHEDGVVYLDGGWQSLVDALAATCRAAGVTIIDHTPVTALTEVDNGWIVTSGEQVLTAQNVIIAAGGPQLATSLLGDDPADWVDRVGPALRASCLDVGGPAGRLRFLQSADEPLYLSLHAPVAALAPDGHHLYSVMRYLAPDDMSTAEENRAALERHALRAGLPERGERAVDRFLAASVVTWGSPQVGVRRPTGLELADRGVLAAGDWIGPNLLADASIVSGAAAGIAAARRAMVMA